MYGKQQTLALLDALRAEVVDIMLFLKSVERIEVLQWDEGQTQPQLLSACSIANPSDKTRLSRSLYVQASQVSAADSPLLLIKVDPRTVPYISRHPACDEEGRVSAKPRAEIPGSL